MRQVIILPLITLLWGLGLSSSCGKTSAPGSGQPGNSAATKAKAKSIALSWDAAQGTPATSYQVYGMPNLKDAEIPIMTVKADDESFDPAKPAVTILSTNRALAPYAGKNFCFVVTAVVDGAESLPSKAVCQKL